jgi:hypothetical protein
MDRKKLIILFFILFAGLILRLYRFDNPIADWHSWRQADTSSVSRIFAENGFDILHPKYHDLSNVPSGRENPQGYRFVEFPIYNIAQAGLYKTIGILPLEGWGRMVTIFSSIASALLVFLILKRHQNETAGLIGAFFFSFLPYSIFYGRTILPDTSTAAAILAGVYFFDLWIGEKSKIKNQKSKFEAKTVIFFVLSILFTSIALLLKPFALFFVFPMVFLAWDKFGKRMFINPYLWIFAIISLLPFAGWRMWISQFPEGIPASTWLFNEGNIRFKGAYFYWVFAERIGKLILGYWGVSLFILGLITKIKSKPIFLYSFIISSLLYLIIIARGNVQHDYYQILIIPTICIFLGLGGEFLLNNTKNLSGKYMGYLIFIVVSAFTIIFSWYYIRDYFNINNNSIVVAGAAVDRLTPKDALIIANYNGDTSFLYQTKRKGWASYQYDLPEMVKLGANYLVIANPVPSDFDFAKKYEIVESTPQYIIFNLNKQK